MSRALLSPGNNGDKRHLLSFQRNEECLFSCSLLIHSSPSHTSIHIQKHTLTQSPGRGVQDRPRATGDKLQSLPLGYYLSKFLPAFVLLWQTPSSSPALLKALFTKIKDRRKHKAQRRVGARMFS